MGASQHSLESKSTTPSSKPTRPLWTKALQKPHQQCKNKHTMIKRRKPATTTSTKRALVKRPPRKAPSRDAAKGRGLERRVSTLKSLVPTSESDGLDGLFRDTADYIVTLQMRVRVMQMMVDAFTNSSSCE